MNNTRGSDTAFYDEEALKKLEFKLTNKAVYDVRWENWKLWFAANMKEMYNKKVIFV